MMRNHSSMRSRRVVGDADVADLARVDQLGERGDGLLERHRLVVEVRVVEVDVVGAEALERGVGGRRMLSAARPLKSGCWLTLVARTTSIAVAARVEPLAEDPLGVAAGVARHPRRVAVGGVDEVAARGGVRVEHVERRLRGRPSSRRRCRRARAGRPRGRRSRWCGGVQSCVSPSFVLLFHANARSPGAIPGAPEDVERIARARTVDGCVPPTTSARCCEPTAPSASDCAASPSPSPGPPISPIDKPAGDPCVNLEDDYRCAHPPAASRPRIQGLHRLRLLRRGPAGHADTPSVGRAGATTPRRARHVRRLPA